MAARPRSGTGWTAPRPECRLSASTTRRSVEAPGEVVVPGADRISVRDAQAVVHREPRADAPMGLEVTAEVVRVDVERRREPHRARAARLEVAARKAEQERGNRVAVG